MSVAIQRKDSGLIWFDTVLQLNRSLSGSVSQHPLEDGTVITDHTTIDNEKFTISGVLSDADFNISRPSLDARNPEVSNKQWINNTPVNGDVFSTQFSNVFISDPTAFGPILPEFASQFLSDQRPSVIVTGISKVKPALTVANELIGMFNNREVFDILDFREGVLVAIYDNCVMTSLSFNEDDSTGDAIFPEISIERVKYAVSASVRVDKRSSLSSAAGKQNKGAQGKIETTTNKDLSKNKARDFTLETAASVKDERSQAVKLFE
jgi:hypothetical protein